VDVIGLFLPCLSKLFQLQKLYILQLFLYCVLFPFVARSTAWVCGRSHAEIVSSNPSGHMVVCLLWELCVVR